MDREGECSRNGGIGKLKKDGSVADSGEIGLQVIDGGGGWVSSGRSGCYVEDRRD